MAALVPIYKGEASATANMTTTGLSATLDGTPASGQLMLAAFSCRGGSNRTITPPSGWTLWPSTRINNGTNTATAIYYKVAGGGESATQGPWTLDTAAAHSALVIETYSGHDTTSGTSFIVTQITNSGSGTSQALTPTGLTSGVTYGLFGAWGNNNQTTYTKPTEMTEANQINTTGGSNITVLGAHEAAVTGATSYTRTATAAGSGNYAITMVVIALQAAATFTRDVPATAVLSRAAGRSVPVTAIIARQALELEMRTNETVNAVDDLFNHQYNSHVALVYITAVDTNGVAPSIFVTLGRIDSEGGRHSVSSGYAEDVGEFAIGLDRPGGNPSLWPAYYVEAIVTGDVTFEVLILPDGRV